uniref:Uncharacterized protein n=1 Tax=Arundo donax TaxID=35708 RepID=A0A0A9TY46_ARUDO
MMTNESQPEVCCPTAGGVRCAMGNKQ